MRVTSTKIVTPQLSFVGHSVDSQGIHLLSEKVQVIQDFPLPLTQCKLCEFLGLINAYHRFIPNSAHMLQSLHDLLKHSKDSKQELHCQG